MQRTKLNSSVTVLTSGLKLDEFGNIETLRTLSGGLGGNGRDNCPRAVCLTAVD